MIVWGWHSLLGQVCVHCGVCNVVCVLWCVCVYVCVCCSNNNNNNNNNNSNNNNTPRSIQ